MGIRLPLTPLSQQFHEVVRDAMRQADVTPASACASSRERRDDAYGCAVVAAVLGLTLCRCGTLFDSARSIQVREEAPAARGSARLDHAGS